MMPPGSIDDLDIHTLKCILEAQSHVTNPTSVEGVTGIPNDINPIAYTAATVNNPDSLSQKQMLADTDCKKFVAAQIPEIDGLQNADCFEYLLMSKLNKLPQGICILNTIWSY